MSDKFPEEKSLYLSLSGSSPYQSFPTEINSPMVHTPQMKIAESTIQSDQEAEVSSSPSGKTGSKTKTRTGSEVPITSAPQRLPDSPFPRKISPKPYKNPGTPYRKVDSPHRDPGVDTPGAGSPYLDKTGDPFEGADSDSESEKTLTAEPEVTPKHKTSPYYITI